MPIQGQANINIGAQNSVANSDSLFTAFNKIQNNFTTLFTTASNYNTFVGNNGIATESTSSTGTLKITNTGVINVIAGTGITVNSANGNVIISMSGDGTGNLVAGVTNVALVTNTLEITGSPIVSAGIMTVDLPLLPALVPGQYATPVMSVDEYGRVTQIANSSIAGTVTSVAVSGGNGISITGSPITSNGTITVTNTGVTRINPGPGIVVTDNTGELTISAKLSSGTVSQVSVSSTTLTITNPTITTAGTITIDLPTNISIVGNITNSGNTITYGNITGNRNVQITGNLTANGNISVAGNLVASTPDNIKIGGGTSSYFLQTDGGGNLSWQPAPGAVGTTTAAAGSNTQVQFNNAGAIGANAGFTFDKVTGVFTAPKLSGNGASVTGVLSANNANFAGSVTGATQSNITTVGNLVNLSVVGNIRANGNVVALGTISSTGAMYALTPSNSISNTTVATTEFVNNVILTKAPLNSPIFTGIPQAPEVANIANVIFPSSQIATLNFVKDFNANKAPLTSPSFNGIPLTPDVTLANAVTAPANQISTINFARNYANSVASNSSFQTSGTLGSARLPSGTILQVQMAVSGPARQQINTTLNVAVLGLKINFTPLSATSRIIIDCVISATPTYVQGFGVYKDGVPTVNNNVGGIAPWTAGFQVTSFIGVSTASDWIMQVPFKHTEISGSIVPRIYEVYAGSHWLGVAYDMYINNRKSNDMASFSYMTIYEVAV
jgi:hypothetical protein